MANGSEIIRSNFGIDEIGLNGPLRKAWKLALIQLDKGEDTGGLIGRFSFLPFFPVVLRLRVWERVEGQYRCDDNVSGDIQRLFMGEPSRVGGFHPPHPFVAHVD